MMKVKDIRGFIFEVYTDQIFQMIDIEEFVKNEIESKGIIVIDEIDKLVKSVTNIKSE
jgi:ATP-dependent protease HslVU (ClpYQ) ATPase subunit